MKGERIYLRGQAEAYKAAADELRISLARVQANARSATKEMVRLECVLREWADRCGGDE